MGDKNKMNCTIENHEKRKKSLHIKSADEWGYQKMKPT